MLKAIVLSLFINFSVFAEDVDLASREAVELLNTIHKEVNITSSIIGSCHEFKVDVFSLDMFAQKSAIKINKVCDDYSLHDQLINGQLDKNAKARKQLLNELKFKKTDNLLSLIKEKKYEKAYHFFQLFYNEISTVAQNASSKETPIGLLIENCSDERARELLDLITLSEYSLDAIEKEDDGNKSMLSYSKKIIPLKIKLTESEQKIRAKICSDNEYKDEAFGWLKHSPSFSGLIEKELMNKKQLFDLPVSSCKESYFYQYTLELTRVKVKRENKIDIYDIMKKFPEDYGVILAKNWELLDKQEQAIFLKKIDDNKIPLLDFHGNYILDSIDDDNIKSKYYPRLAGNIYNELFSGNAKNSNLAKIIANNPNLLLDSKYGEDIISILKKKNLPKILQIEVDNALFSAVIDDIGKNRDDKGLKTLLNNGDFSNPSRKIALESIILRNLGQSYYDQYVQDFPLEPKDNEASLLIKKMITNNEKISEKALEENSKKVCSIIKMYSTSLDCEKFISNTLAQRQNNKNDEEYVEMLVNLIEKSYLSNQGTVSYLIAQYLGQINPTVAKELLKRMNLKQDLIEKGSIDKIFKSVKQRIETGEIDCSTRSDILINFIAKNITYKKEVSPKKCSVGNLNNKLQFLEINSKNQPVFINGSMRDFESNLKNSSNTMSVPKQITIIKDEHNAEILSKITSKDDVRDHDRRMFKSLIHDGELANCKNFCNNEKYFNLLGNAVDRFQDVMGTSSDPIAKVLQKTPASVYTVPTYQLYKFTMKLLETKSTDEECKVSCLVGSITYTGDELRKMKMRLKAIEKALLSSNDGELAKVLDLDLAEFEKQENGNSLIKDKIVQMKKQLDKIAIEYSALAIRNQREIALGGADLEYTINLLEVTIKQRDQLIKDFRFALENTKIEAAVIKNEQKQAEELEKLKKKEQTVNSPGWHDSTERERTREQVQEARQRQAETREAERVRQNEMRHQQEERNRQREIREERRRMQDEKNERDLRNQLKKATRT